MERNVQTNIETPFVLTLREVTDQRDNYGHDNRSINRHSVRMFLSTEGTLTPPEQDTRYLHTAFVLDRTMDGVPPFYSAMELTLESGSIWPQHQRRIRVQGNEYWGDGLSWPRAKELFIAALAEHVTAETGAPATVVMGEPLGEEEMRHYRDFRYGVTMKIHLAENAEHEHASPSP